MSSAAANAYARIANTTSSPRDIEAQALLKAANKLQAIVTNENATSEQISEALMFNRKLWAIFLSDVLRDENQQLVRRFQQGLGFDITGGRRWCSQYVRRRWRQH